jgi:hypothetical protein
MTAPLSTRTRLYSPKTVQVVVRRLMTEVRNEKSFDQPGRPALDGPRWGREISLSIGGLVPRPSGAWEGSSFRRSRRQANN